MILDFFGLALRNIVHRKRRSWLTIIGILIGIAAVVALVSLGQGLEDSVEREFENIGSDKIFIQPGGGQQDRFTGTSALLTDDDLATVRRTRGVERAAGTVFTSVNAEFRGESEFVTLIGTPTGENRDLVLESWSLEFESGRTLRETDRSNILVGSRVAGDVYSNDVSVRSKLDIEDRGFRVVGVLKPSGDPAIDRGIFMPIDQARQITGKDRGYGYIIVQVQDGFRPDDVSRRLERNLRQERNLDEGEEDFTIQTPEDLLQSFQNIIGVVRGVVIGIASISLLVGGVGIMNTMYTSVSERTREIGVMKAVGATNRQILSIFILESGLIGLVGGLLGVTLGLAMSTAASFFASQAVNLDVRPYLGPELVIGSLVFAFLVGTLSGVFPARKAAKLQPADALRYE
ncbi:MAG: ABC transporter permease [Candidatus Nanohaloarchaea archaeon]